MPVTRLAPPISPLDHPTSAISPHIQSLPQVSHAHRVSKTRNLLRQHLHQAHPQQNTRADGVQRSQRHNRLRIVPVEALQGGNADDHTNGRDQREDGSHETLVFERGGPERGDAGAESEALEHLMEEDDDKEGSVEGVGSHAEGYADDCNGLARSKN